MKFKKLKQIADTHEVKIEFTLVIRTDITVPEKYRKNLEDKIKSCGVSIRINEQKKTYKVDDDLEQATEVKDGITFLK